MGGFETHPYINHRFTPSKPIWPADMCLVRHDLQGAEERRKYRAAFSYISFLMAVSPSSSHHPMAVSVWLGAVL
jgi:hypothetical protein